MQQKTKYRCSSKSSLSQLPVNIKTYKHSLFKDVHSPRQNVEGTYQFTPVRPSIQLSPKLVSLVIFGYKLYTEIKFPYSFGDTDLICCRMFIHMMEVYIATGF